jgi:ubiquinone/menaquinone biosynthesis C-methylase UbiE/cytosine/adenosine deaminase-related metal-dependent hydrolase
MTQSLLSYAAAFDAWADVYDDQPNPLLALEQRVLPSLLPDVRGLDVLDIGCGTGRWLAHFAERSPRRLTGVDFSAEMLAVAARKLGDHCELKQGDCKALPVETESADLVISSFVLSYVDDLKRYAIEVERVLRPGGVFLLTDMHPETEALLGWKRSYSAHGTGVSLNSCSWFLPGIIDVCQWQGLRLMAQFEPSFGVEEHAIFARGGKSAAWAGAVGHPAIYVLKWYKPVEAAHRRHIVFRGEERFTLRGARCATGPDEAEALDLTIGNGRIQSVANQWASARAEIDLHLPGYLLLPGLINAHDHLEFGLFPRLGNGPYQNASQWAQDIHRSHAATIAQFRRVPKNTSVLWGAIRNLLCGVTTVCHHNPLSAEMEEPGFPVRVVKDFAWAHSFAFDPALAAKVATSNPSFPFIVHAAEGIDEKSANEIFLLDRMHALNHRTLLVHGLACSAESIALINQRFAGVILCPTSNQFLFHRSPQLNSIRSLGSVLLGSDSPLTAAGDYLDEIGFLHRYIGLDAISLYRMVTTNAAQALRLRGGEGTLAPGAVADVLVLRDAGLTPAEALARMTMEQLELVVLGGRVQLASSAFLHRLPKHQVEKLEPLEVDGHRRWVRAPIRKLMATTEEFLGETVKVGGKRMRYVPAA